MTIETLDRTRWKDFFDRVTKALENSQVSIEVSGLSFAQQFETESTRLFGFAYDPRADVLEVATEAVDHAIPGPRRVAVEMRGTELESIWVDCDDERSERIRMLHPLAITGP
ncbi:MAG: DUF5335 family protein [Planctomycetes bacterium]|nr:DUF5335 family protein [Planctomycetota bacterium]